jgi:tyrosine-protein kinase Etk/Wzc
MSMNLAAALAQGGKKVVLVDTDMRRPSVYWRLGLTEKKGLSEFLTGMEPMDAVIQTHKNSEHARSDSVGDVPAAASRSAGL